MILGRELQRRSDMRSRLTVLTYLLSLATATIASAQDRGRETLPPNDGWASFGAGTTGGASATAEQVYVVRNRRELIAALNNGVPSSTSPSSPSNAPKIIYVKGTIDANVDDGNQPLACEDYYRNGYTLEAFLAFYDPDGPWGRVPPSGELENARLASRDAQQARVRIRPGDNTTIIGVGSDATVRGAWIDVRGSAATPRRNIIIRNITFQDTYDCFPQWSPTDGALGSWNALYDSISLRDTTNVWIDHNTFEDRATADSTLPNHFGVLYQVHDGLADITNASDLVTVSWNRFVNHDKTMLIGSSDNAPADVGKLRVTIHHNLYENTGQRSPRVRYGQDHVFNNYYVIENPSAYSYSWGVGIQSEIYAQNNYFRTSEEIAPADFIARFNGTAVYVAGTLVNGKTKAYAVDLVSEYNAVNTPDLVPAVSWTPTLFGEIHPTAAVEGLVSGFAGPFKDE
jgi:pectate lyase